MASSEVRYVHTENIHNTNAAEQVVPYLISLLYPESVVDVGCGLATWLTVFNANGVAEILGIDGSYVEKSKLKVDQQYFIEHDLETPYQPIKKYDLALSLEVAEHLKECSADIFVDTLTNLSDVVIFSAAIKNQGGQNHINEQNPIYWISKFEERGYQCLDILRPVFWNNEKIECWYRQNMFLYTNNAQLIERVKNHDSFLKQNLVHPQLLEIKDRALNNYIKEFASIRNGKKALKFYLKIVWTTAINIFSKN